MRGAGVPLFSLENHLPARAFDVIAFNLSAELVYTNVLNLVDLAAVPVRSRDRNGGRPLVVAGGHCAFNPEPLADFVDAFVIGDGEEVVGEITDVLGGWLARPPATRDRADVLAALAGVEGVYVPAPLRAPLRRRPAGGHRAGAGIRSPRRRSRSARWPTWRSGPTRGASWSRSPRWSTTGSTWRCSGAVPAGCRFCQAGMITRPVRERPADQVRRMVREGLERTGYDEVALTSLSTADFSGIEDTVTRHHRGPGARRTGVGQPAEPAGRRLHRRHGSPDPAGAPHRAHLRSRRRHLADAAGDQQAHPRGGSLRRGRRRLQPGLAPGQALLPHRAAHRARRGRARPSPSWAPGAWRSGAAITSR